MNLLVVAALAWAIGLPRFGTHSIILTSAEDPNSLTQDYPTFYKLDKSYNTDFDNVEFGNYDVSRYNRTIEMDQKWDCYEKVEKPDRLHSRRDWDYGKDRLALEFPVDVVVLRDGGNGCSEWLECRTILRLMKGPRRDCDLRDNFYVGGDGNVYEGRGWDAAPYGHLLGLRRHAITVRFLGKPSSPALQAYAMLITSGVWRGHLSRDYKVITMGRLLSDSRFSSEELVETVEGWERRTDVARLSTRWEFVVPRRLTLILREEWNGSAPKRTQREPKWDFEHVMISESGEGCRSRVTCLALIGSCPDDLIKTIQHNFYITEGGVVYEGRGWDYRRYYQYRYYSKDYMTIQLCGNFTRTLPSKEAINSLKLLMANGEELGKLSPNYKLLSIDVHQPSSMGSAFKKYVEGWSVWQNDV